MKAKTQPKTALAAMGHTPELPRDRDSFFAAADRFITLVGIQEGPLPEAARQMLRFKRLGEHCPKRSIRKMEEAFIRFSTAPKNEFKRERNGLLRMAQAPPKMKKLAPTAA